MIHAKLDGTEAIIATLQEVKNRAANKEIGRIVRQEMKPMLNTARGRAPMASGLLRSQIGFIDKNNSRFPTTGLIGVNFRGEGRKRGNSAYYAHIVEYGGKTIRRTPRPFMRPAFEMHKDRTIERIKTRIFDRLNLKKK